MLKSQRITFRALEPIDVDTLYQWENDPDVWHVGNTVAPYSRKLLWEYIDTYEADIFKSRQLRFMIETNEPKQPIGTIDLFDFDPVNSRCGIGILVIPPFRRMGIAEEGLRLIADYCRLRLSLHQLYCIISSSNQASRRLFESVGFSISGRLRSWLREGGAYGDAYIYQKLL